MGLGMAQYTGCGMTVYPGNKWDFEQPDKKDEKARLSDLRKKYKETEDELGRILLSGRNVGDFNMWTYFALHRLKKTYEKEHMYPSEFEVPTSYTCFFVNNLFKMLFIFTHIVWGFKAKGKCALITILIAYVGELVCLGYTYHKELKDVVDL